MPLVGVNVNGELLTWDEYLASNRTDIYPRPIRYVLYEHAVRTRRSWVSVTTVLTCLRRAKWELTCDYYSTEPQIWQLTRGTVIHEILSRYKSNASDCLVEYELKKEVANVTIVGHLDLYENGVLYDYKTVGDGTFRSVIKSGPKEEHVRQANVYAWMLDRPVTDICIVYISMHGIACTGRSSLVADNGKLSKVTIARSPIYPHKIIENTMYDLVCNLHKSDIPPATKYTWMCSSCPFSNRCRITKETSV